MNYQVGDFILRIKNAYGARRKQVSMQYSNINKAVAAALVKEGFLAKVEQNEVDGHKRILVSLRYENRKPVLREVRLISKPSLRVYVGADELKLDKDRIMTSILSTSTGVMSGKEAIKKGVGGELLFKVG
jgi:small subunit ribosomal protein S8